MLPLTRLPLHSGGRGGLGGDASRDLGEAPVCLCFVGVVFEDFSPFNLDGFFNRFHFFEFRFEAFKSGFPLVPQPLDPGMDRETLGVGAFGLL